MNQTTEHLTVKNFGPILDVDIKFGDLTILIGPQASGKSLLLELFKLVEDHDHIVSTLSQYNYVLGRSAARSLPEYYFGEGLSSLVKDSTTVSVNGEDVTERLTDASIKTEGPAEESIFYIPAQRILSIADGRPKNFMEYDLSTPYPLRIFSETLRVFMQGGLSGPDIIFPMSQRLNKSVRDSINSSIFHNGKVIMDESGGQRKMKLSIDGLKLPFMTWSAGQKEFMPLLLAIYCLTEPSSSVVKRKDYKWVVIEEPEMGLHPKAIESVIIEIIGLMQQGFKVILSTHSSVFIDFVWALEFLSDLDQHDFRDALCRLFRINSDNMDQSIFDGLQQKDVKVYYLDTKSNSGVVSADISTLDVMDDDEIISEWGGLSSFASRASEIVSEYGED